MVLLNNAVSVCLLLSGSVNEKAFGAIAAAVQQAHELLGEACDSHGRCEQLRKYVMYAFNAPVLVEKQAALKTEAQVNGRPRSAALGAKAGMSCTVSEYLSLSS